MNSVYVISLTIAIILVIGIFLYIIFRHNEKFAFPGSRAWAEAIETAVAADQDVFDNPNVYLPGWPTPPAYHTKLHKNINQISTDNFVSGYTQTIGNGIYGYTLVNTSAGNISNVNISITSTWPNGSIWLYNFDKSGNMSPKYDTLATPTTITYNYTPFPTASSTFNIIPPGGYFVIDASLLSANSTVTFTINSITFS